MHSENSNIGEQKNNVINCVFSTDTDIMVFGESL